MNPQGINDEHIGQRSELRTSMFVQAAMATDSVCGPVTIRNLSQHGAMIEADNLPRVGSRLHLRRGSLEAEGLVVWKSHRRAGVRWQQPIIVGAWLPSRHSAQSLVDSNLIKLRAGQALPAAIEPALRLAPAFHANELRQTAAALDKLADLLADDSEVIARYGTRLQALDIASQAILRIADSLAEPKT